MSEEIFCYAYTIFALEHVDQHVDEDVEVRVELDGVHKIARDVAHHVVQSGVRSAEAAQWRRGHHCGVVWATRNSRRRPFFRESIYTR